MEISATEFKAKCLALIDQVHSTREPVLIRKRGKIVAKLLPENDPDEKPWLATTSTSTIDHGGKALLGKILAGKQNFHRL
jgi:antitoxin (DNA-binding transcriptional repressor) of toxin-antitoxin stability system